MARSIQRKQPTGQLVQQQLQGSNSSMKKKLSSALGLALVFLLLTVAAPPPQAFAQQVPTPTTAVQPTPTPTPTPTTQVTPTAPTTAPTANPTTPTQPTPTTPTNSNNNPGGNNSTTTTTPTRAPTTTPTPTTSKPPSSAPTPAKLVTDGYASKFDGKFKCGLTSADLPLVIVYYESWQTSNLTLFDYPNFPKVVILAFSQVDYPSGMPADPASIYAHDSIALKQGIQMVHAKGSKVFLSIGGASNCGEGLVGDYLFNPSYRGKEKAFAKRLVGFIEEYGFDGIDFDYECIEYLPGTYKRYQNADIAKLYIEALHNELGDKPVCLSWSGFSSIQVPENAYHDAFIATKDYMDMFFWMAYNMEFRSDYENIPNSFNQLLACGIHPSRVSIGICVGSTCAYHPWAGPLQQDKFTYMNIMIQRKGLGLMVWAGFGDFWNSTGATLDDKMRNSLQALAYDTFGNKHTVYLPKIYPVGAFDRILGISSGASGLSISLLLTFASILLVALFLGGASSIQR